MMKWRDLCIDDLKEIHLESRRSFTSPFMPETIINVSLLILTVWLQRLYQTVTPSVNHQTNAGRSMYGILKWNTETAQDTGDITRQKLIMIISNGKYKQSDWVQDINGANRHVVET